MSAKRRKRRDSTLGRLLEGLADAALILVVLAFGVSIAARYSPEPREIRPVQSILPPASPPAEVPHKTDWRDRPTIDIRNGCGQQGLAKVMTERLRLAGFDVVNFRNADRDDYARTLVKDRSGKPIAADRVRDWMRLEFGVGEIVRDPIEAPEADVLLILGADLADTLRRREREGR